MALPIALEHLFFFQEAFQLKEEGYNVFEIKIHLTSAGLAVQYFPESFDIHAGEIVLFRHQGRIPEEPCGILDGAALQVHVAGDGVPAEGMGASDSVLADRDIQSPAHASVEVVDGVVGDDAFRRICRKEVFAAGIIKPVDLFQPLQKVTDFPGDGELAIFAVLGVA